MSFFDEPFIKKEIDQIDFLRDLVSGLEEAVQKTNNEELAVEYWHAMYALVEKQHVVYTRLMYTDDPEALMLKKNLEDTAMELNNSVRPINMPEYYTKMKSDIKGFISGLTGENLDDYEGIDVDFEIDL